MPVAEPTNAQLTETIRKILGAAGDQALRMRDIEFQLNKLGNWADTFDIRDAVAELIDQEVVEEVHPGRLLKLAGSR